MGGTYWNYRILVHPGQDGAGDYFAVHEVFYTDDTPDAWTVHPVDFGAESAKGVVAMLEQALADVKRSEPLRLSKDGHTIVHVKDDEEERGESDG